MFIEIMMQNKARFNDKNICAMHLCSVCMCVLVSACTFVCVYVLYLCMVCLCQCSCLCMHTSVHVIMKIYFNIQYIKIILECSHQQDPSKLQYKCCLVRKVFLWSLLQKLPHLVCV